MKSKGRWIKVVAVVSLLCVVSGCVIRPLGWGHRHGGGHRYDEGHRGVPDRSPAPSYPRERR